MFNVLLTRFVVYYDKCLSLLDIDKLQLIESWNKLLLYAVIILKFQINNSSEFELTRHQLQDRREKLLTSVLQLKFRIGVKHFQGGLLQIRCEARLFDQRWETLWNISHQNYQTPFRTAGQNRYSLSGVEGGLFLINIGFLLLQFYSHFVNKLENEEWNGERNSLSLLIPFPLFCGWRSLLYLISAALLSHRFPQPDLPSCVDFNRNFRLCRDFPLASTFSTTATTAISLWQLPDEMGLATRATTWIISVYFSSMNEFSEIAVLYSCVSALVNPASLKLLWWITILWTWG